MVQSQGGINAGGNNNAASSSSSSLLGLDVDLEQGCMNTAQCTSASCTASLVYVVILLELT
jgi:hypothetical protein